VIVVDTSVWIDYFRQQKLVAQESIEIALKEGRVYVPPIVVAELLSSTMRSVQRNELELFLRELAWCECDITHWIRVGALRASLAMNGYSVSTPDAHIAQCAIDLNAILYSKDAIFRKISARAGFVMG